MAQILSQIAGECGIKEVRFNHINSVFVGMGANLGDRVEAMTAALRMLEEPPEITLVRASSLYETAPVGVTEQPDFLNAAAELETTLTPHALLARLLHLENQMGRTRTQKWGPRVIDLDLLLYGRRQVCEPNLRVPHPFLRERGFVLVPLAEIAPDLTLPGDEKKVSDLADFFFQSGNIRRLPVVQRGTPGFPFAQTKRENTQ